MAPRHLLSFNDVSMRYGGPAVLEHVSFTIASGERACVTGRNGEGKSTLLKIMAGVLEPDSGAVICAPDVRVAYLSQDVPNDMPGTVGDICGEGAARALTCLGLDATQTFNTLSGGMRRRVLLARAIASDPHVLLLDEPTNHLDIASIEWLETFLDKNRTMACLFVTHDRAFLKRVARRVFDLDRGRLAGWDCDYATFMRRKRELLDDEAVFWERKTKKLAQEEAWIRRGVKARTTRNEGRVAALMKLREEFRQRRGALGVSRIQIGSGGDSGERVFKIEDLSFTYPGAPRPVIRKFTANVLRGERIGIIGPNGAGKTTLLNLICGRLAPDSGMVVPGTRIAMAFFDQLRAQLNLDETVVTNVAGDHDEVVVGGVRKHVYSYLADFLFTSDRARTPVHALSGGERARLLLAKLFLTPSNVLVMDEPTNDLDIETLELLEEQLLAYPGTLLLVSHDRVFLDNVVTGTFALDGEGNVGIYPGGYADWQRQSAAQRAATVVETKAPPPQPRVATESTRSKRLGYKEQRELATLPETIDALEREIATIHATLSDGAIYRDDPQRVETLNARLPVAEAALEVAFERWAELEERKES